MTHMDKASTPDSGIRVPQRPALAVPPRPRFHLLGSRLALMPSLWAWPLVLSILLVSGVMIWLQSKEVSDREAQRAEMISDALSLEAQITSRLDEETNKLRALADVIQSTSLSQDAFARHPLVLDGLRRFWVSLTWLGDDGRIMAHVPDDAMPAHDKARNIGDEGGMAGHLSVSLTGRNEHLGGMLVARYSAGALLRQKVPWWLAAKYDIRLVDESDGVIASTVEGPRHPTQPWYRVSMAPSLPDAWLELSSHERITPWWRSMPMVLMSGFVVLLGIASVMLRKQMQSVSRAEEAWRTEAAWRSAMEDSLAVGIRARDMQGRLVYVNKTMADMVGYQPDELIGLMPPMPYWVPHELEQSMSRHLRNMAGKAPREGYESRWQHRDGSEVDVMVFEAPLVDAKGVQIGWMASVLNVTERKRLEERERKQMETMSHHARLTMLGEVASTLAHELNQPLSAIASYNAGLLNALGSRGDMDPQIVMALQRMGEQAAHAGRIVKRIREFLTRREPRREHCNIMAVIESGVSLLRRDLSRHDVQVSIHSEPNVPEVVADPVLIEQVVINLVRNASDALVGQAGERRILISAAQAGRFVRVSVTDNGPGLQGQRGDRLFAPFYSTKAE
ncbi:MAG: PAS domain S-box protein, partial [Aquabacterium sp.]|nr:PAS domain S-box protein [Aquabacterium sp.]